jgi:hypothetical protein
MKSLNVLPDYKCGKCGYEFQDKDIVNVQEIYFKPNGQILSRSTLCEKCSKPKKKKREL